ncbi:unnamed protein product [Prorocentrum cordatum]|uniref:Calmodulin-lysine N-methyltransferase n=1 Tax=Prorocentrum cordatum TaxID=2364126 RepID=A0ABN9SD59_9DINO|nr:unnamed protein product [Polarella glacialis]
MAIVGLLDDPNAADALNPDAADMLDADRKQGTHMYRDTGALELLRAVEARDAQDAQVLEGRRGIWGATSGAAECGGGAGEFGGFGHGGGPSSLVAGLQAPRCESPPFGLSIWSASFGLARHLLENREELARADLGAGRAVLELGCGQPLLAMVLLEAFPRLGRVVATDGHEGVLRLARQNLAENVPSPRPEAVLAQLRWGDAGDMARAEEINEGRKYDVILGADVTYDHDEMGHALVQTIVGLAHRGTVVWLAHELRADDRMPRRRSLCAGRPARRVLRPEDRTICAVPEAISHVGAAGAEFEKQRRDAESRRSGSARGRGPLETKVDHPLYMRLEAPRIEVSLPFGHSDVVRLLDFFEVEKIPRLCVVDHRGITVCDDARGGMGFGFGLSPIAAYEWLASRIGFSAEELLSGAAPTAAAKALAPPPGDRTASAGADDAGEPAKNAKPAKPSA